MISQKTVRQIGRCVEELGQPLRSAVYLFSCDCAQDLNTVTGGNNKTLTNYLAVDKPGQTFSAGLV
jgi:hypothetical protein